MRKYQDRECTSKNLFLNVLKQPRSLHQQIINNLGKFIIVKDLEKRRKIGDPTTWAKFIKDAPVLIVGCITEPSFKMGRWYDSSILDIGIAMEHIALQATHLGLGTCWIATLMKS